jgi:hypothetical protein
VVAVNVASADPQNRSARLQGKPIVGPRFIGSKIDTVKMRQRRWTNRTHRD